MTEGKVKARGLALTQHTHKHMEVYSLGKDCACGHGPKSLNEAKAAWRL